MLGAQTRGAIIQGRFYQALKGHGEYFLGRSPGGARSGLHDGELRLGFRRDFFGMRCEGEVRVKIDTKDTRSAIELDG